MEYNVENRVLLSTEREHETLYDWSIKEYGAARNQIGRDQIPWPWSLNFEVAEMIPTCKLHVRGDEEDQSGFSAAEVSQYLYGTLRPSVLSRQSGSYSMFGTNREVSQFSFFIYRSTDGKDRCSLWGSVSYDSEWDFQNVTEPDSVQIYIHLKAEKYDELISFVKFPRPTGVAIRLTGVSGFYSEWSPSIRADRIKILANAKDQRLENPENLDFTPPTLGFVKEFELTMQQKYPLSREAT